MLPKKRSYVKVVMIKLNEYIFWLTMITYYKYILLFGIKLALILKKNFIPNLSTIKSLWKPKLKTYGDKVTDFFIKKFLRWALIILV